MAVKSFAILFIISSFAGGSGRQQAGAPKPVTELFVASDRCIACHNGLITASGQDVSIGANWQSSMMAHSSKDPYWQAAVRRETLDHPVAAAAIEHECAACHMPMTRYAAKVSGRKGQVFGHLPVAPNAAGADAFAVEGVSCTMCHQIQEEGLSTKESFTAGFVVDTQKPLGQRSVFGPYEVDTGRTRVMRSSAQVVPAQSKHVQGSDLCASCHTLYTHALGPDGEVIGELPEQVPYLEWKHSAYADKRHCQSCHMPQLTHPMQISSVLGQSREAFSRHVFRGGNFFMPAILDRYRQELGVTARSEQLERAAEQTRDNLTGSSAKIEIAEVERRGEQLQADVRVVNLTGHKLPTAYPSRRAWIHLTVKDREGQIVFESGALRSDGSIAGNDNDRDRTRFEPHYAEITKSEQVQIYEAIMADSKEEVTTGLLSAVRFIKDNRILPRGFDKATAHKDIAVRGAASADEDFTDERDTVHYVVSVGPAQGPLVVEAELWYQPIAFRWAQNLKQQPAAETDRFVSYYNSMSDESGILMAKAMMAAE